MTSESATLCPAGKAVRGIHPRKRSPTSPARSDEVGLIESGLQRRCRLCGESGVADEVVDGGLVGGRGVAELAGRCGGGEVGEAAGRTRSCRRVRNMAVCRPGSVTR